MGPYPTFEACEDANQDKSDPAAYCGEIKKRTEDIIPPECIVKTINHYKTKYPEWSMNDVLKKSFNYLKNRDGNDFINTCDYNQDGKCINERNENYKKECPYENIDKCPTSDFIEDLNDLEFRKSERIEDYEVWKNIELYKDNKYIGGISYTYLSEDSPYEKPDQDVQIENFEVVNEERGKGYGKLILENILKDIDDKNWSTTLGIAPSIYSSKEQLESLYSQFGFRKPTQEEQDKYLKKHQIPIGKSTMLRDPKGQGKGWYGESERHSKARKFGKADTLDFILLEIAQEYEQQVQDFLTLDAEADDPTRLQQQFETLKLYEESYRTPEAQALRASLGGTLKPMVQGIERPFELINTETGAIVRGSVLESFEKNIKQLTPVSSSNVKGVGQFKNELLVQFYPSKGISQRTYRYNFASPNEAEQAYRSLTNTGSPGRWIWQNIRGHTKGELTGIKNVPHKYGPSLKPPGTGKKVIGGTSASLVEYAIANRTPVARVGNFEGMIKQLQRQTSNPTLNPQEGTPIERQLGNLKDWRKIGLLKSARGQFRQISQLPKLDFTITDIEDPTFTKFGLKKIQPKEKEHWVTIRGNPVLIKESSLEKQIEKLAKRIITFGSLYVFETKEELEGFANTLRMYKQFNKNFAASMIHQELNKLEKYLEPFEGTTSLEALEESISRFRSYLDYKPKEKEITFTGLGLKKKLDFTVKVLDANDLITDSFEELLAWVKEKKKPKDDEEAEQIAWAIINNAQTKATEKAKKPYKEGKFYDISALKKKLPEGERWRLQFIEDAIKLFPKKAFKKANPEILIVSKITDHEDWKQYKGKVPVYYQQMGIDRTYDEGRGIYHPVYNQCVISLKNNPNGYYTMNTVYHEVAHAVWEYGGTPLHLKQRLVQDVKTYQKDIENKYYHEPTEMFALLFEIEGHELLFKEKAKIQNERVVQEFIQLYDRFREVMS